MDWRLFYNPLAVLKPRTAVVLAAVTLIVLTAVAWWGGVHLDGAFDFHVYEMLPSLPLVILESLVDWLSLGLLLFAATKLFRGRGDAGTHLLAAALARVPYIFTAIIGSEPLLGKVMRAAVSYGGTAVTLQLRILQSPGVVLGFVAIAALVVWSVVILYLSYKEVSRLDSGKAPGAFILGAILAEIVSKLAILGLAKAGV